jgi:hypothetical protein
MEFKTGWPQLLWFFSFVSGTLMIIMKHGQPRQKSVGATIFGSLIAVGIYYAGGFFDNVFWPHFVVIGMFALSFALEAREQRNPRYNFFITLPFSIIVVYMLYLGKFLVH